ncbi:unnamed protein product [Symbiodinium natans]|uniref:Uncharacterized protein n=1 Tax=Symbiodinium natans TaxID=878477 RepID=A0A812MMV7_9DINO|nr:unnamed protein product [Symbiodinium natans]
MCAVIRRLVRKLRPGGAMWVGFLSDPHFAVPFTPEDQELCMQLAAKKDRLVYAYMSEMEIFGVTEAFSSATRSLLLAKPSASERATGDEPWRDIDRDTQRAAAIYGCPEASEASPSPAAEAVAELRTSWLAPSEARSWRTGPSFWLCAQRRLEERGRELRGGLWVVDAFASRLEAQHVRRLLDLPPAPESRRDTWADDLLIPTAVDIVLDDLEARLEEDLGLPRAHSNPWHLLRYGAGFAGRYLAADCQAEASDEEQHVTVLLFASPCWSELSPCVPSDSGADLPDGAAFFPKLGLRVRLPEGGLLAYSRNDGCHLLAALAAEAPEQVSSQAQVVVMRTPRLAVRLLA